jgi:multiple sugar transport system ATP-binding protein
MNLMQGTDSGGTFSVQGTEINGISAPVGAMTLGFRAEVVESGGQINAAIYALELLGDATMVTVRLDGTLVSVRADKTFRAEFDWSISNSVANEICQLFDGQTGARLEA